MSHVSDLGLTCYESVINSYTERSTVRGDTASFIHMTIQCVKHVNQNADDDAVATLRPTALPGIKHVSPRSWTPVRSERILRHVGTATS